MSECLVAILVDNKVKNSIEHFVPSDDHLAQTVAFLIPLYEQGFLQFVSFWDL